MAEGALGISTGIGQGEAQIIKPFQSPVTAQQYGSVMAAQQKAQQDAAAKKAKAAASIADFQFKGLPQHAELFAKGYDDVVNYAIENIDDPLIEFKLKQRMSDLNTKANMSADLKANLQKQADFVQQGQGKNYYLGFDEAVKEVVTPIDYTTFQDTNKFGQAIGGKANLLNGVKTVPIYDIGAAKASLQNQISGWAKDNMQGKSWQADDKIINSFVEAELTGHPEAIVHFERVMKTDPIGAKAAGNDPYQYGFNELKKDLKAKGYTTGGNTNITLNTGSNAPSSSSVFNGNTVFGSGDTAFVQEGQPAASFPVKSTIASPDPDTFDPVNFKKVNSGAVKNVQYGSMIVSDTLDEDLDFGNGYVIPKGTPIPQGKSMGDIALMYFGQQAGFDKTQLDLIKQTPEYKKYVNRLPKTTIGLFAVGAGKDESGDEMSVYTPLQKVWGAIQGGLSKDDEGKLNMQGKIIYDEYIKKGGKPFSIVGVTESAKPAGGDKRNSALLYTFNGKDWSLDQLITKYGSEENAKKAIAKFGFKQKK